MFSLKLFLFHFRPRENITVKPLNIGQVQFWTSEAEEDTQRAGASLFISITVHTKLKSLPGSLFIFSQSCGSLPPTVGRHPTCPINGLTVSSPKKKERWENIIPYIEIWSIKAHLSIVCWHNISFPTKCLCAWLSDRKGKGRGKLNFVVFLIDGNHLVCPNFTSCTGCYSLSYFSIAERKEEAAPANFVLVELFFPQVTSTHNERGSWFICLDIVLYRQCSIDVENDEQKKEHHNT